VTLLGRTPHTRSVHTFRVSFSVGQSKCATRLEGQIVCGEAELTSNVTWGLAQHKN